MQLDLLAKAVFSGRTPSRLKPSHVTVSARVIGARDVTTSLAPPDALEDASVPDTVETDRLRVEERDVVVTARGTSIRAGVAGPEHRGVVAGANLVVVRLRQDALPPALLAAYLRHPVIQKHLLSDFAGSTTSGFSVETLKQLEIVSLDPELATSLADLVGAVESYAHSVQRAAELRRIAALEAVFSHLSPPELRAEP